MKARAAVFFMVMLLAFTALFLGLSAVVVYLFGVMARVA